MTQKPVPEFSRPVGVEELEPGAETHRRIEADESECAALAGRLGLVQLDGLSAEVTLRRLRGGVLIRASGRLAADVVQRCVVTLGPVPAHIDEAFDEIFAPVGYEPAEGEDGDDLPDYFDGREIDIGELAAQLLSLSLNPYPRARDISPELPGVAEPDATESRRPFEGLAEMLKKRK